MNITVKQCVFCDKEFVDNVTLEHLVEHMQDDGCMTKLEKSLNKVEGHLALSDLTVVLDILKNNCLEGGRGVLEAGNAMFHFDKKYHVNELNEPLYMLPSRNVWQPKSAMSFDEFEVFVSKYRALSAVVCSKELLTNLGYWKRFEGLLGVSEAWLCNILKAIVMGGEFWVTATQFLDIANPLLTLVSALACSCSSVSTIYVSAQTVKDVADLSSRQGIMSDSFLTSFHRIPTLFGTPLHIAAGVFNPMYMVRKNLWSEVYRVRNDLLSMVDSAMKGFFKDIVGDEEWDKFLEDLETYIREGPSLAGTMLECHPAHFWYVNGHTMKVLAKYALTIVSYPHPMIFLKSESHLEKFVSTPKKILVPSQAKFNNIDSYSGSFEEYMMKVTAIFEDHDEDNDDFDEDHVLLSLFASFY